MRRPAADFGDGLIMRAAGASAEDGPTYLTVPSSRPTRPTGRRAPRRSAVRRDQKEHEVGKITLDRLLIGTQPLGEGV